MFTISASISRILEPSPQGLISSSMIFEEDSFPSMTIFLINKKLEIEKLFSQAIDISTFEV
jgi:hypothetical protein